MGETVHLLCEGQPLCRFTSAMPREWPPDHKWVSFAEPKGATCEACLAALRGGPERPPPFSVEEMVEQKTVLMHLPTGTIGRAEKHFDGVDEVHRGLDGEPVKAPVLLLDTGDAFLVTPEAFAPLSGREVELWTAVTRMTTSAITIGLQLGQAARIKLPVACAILGACLRGQDRVLGALLEQTAAAEEKEKKDGTQAAAKLPPDVFG